MEHFYPGHKHSWHLIECIDVPENFQEEKVIRCRIEYNAHLFSIHYYPYVSRQIHSIKMVPLPNEFDYRYKYADRKLIEDLYDQRDGADEILMVKDGWITDTSIANIALSKNGKWYTPSIPLLAGTTWKRLIHAGSLIPKPIHATDMGNFDTFRIFNAMNSFNEAEEIPIKNIN